MSDIVYGEQYKQTGSSSSMIINKSGGVSRGELDAAVLELRAFVAQLTRDGAVSADGSVTDPAAVVTAVESQPSRLKALGTAIAGGAKDAVLSVVKDGVAAMIVALVGRM
ncbi:hypothetical protein Acor_33550 [Acrocarpospora corrugata]|uniref:Uncharacterized protein n=1 Tax=Acrocarpospora corrugata TaxID=35763 RepID=A0A5M3W2C8_9ACTN|nr:hypothetical protein [Acrocarpospora corrugata]GES01291.1 hypothetical protein Acor_33550 [Acrocarpospora corrugata]